MEFERSSKYSQRTARFEIDSETGFHEAIVARRALGSSVARYRTKLDKAYSPGRLGVRLGKLSTTELDSEGEMKPVPVEMKMQKSDAAILMGALQDFINDTPTALMGIATGDPSNCSIRVVEGMMAQGMLNQLKDEFGQPEEITQLTAGFN